MEKKYTILNFYKFFKLDHLEGERAWLTEQAEALSIKGGFILASEGMNAALGSTSRADLETFLDLLDARWKLKAEDKIYPHWTEGFTRPFRKFFVKIKDYIVVFDEEEKVPLEKVKHDQASHVDADTWDRAIAQSQAGEAVILDTRNYYEIDYGKFQGAEDLNLKHFRDFPAALRSQEKWSKETPLYMYCTGGIRCEKAVQFAKKEGFKNVFQLEGGILEYFKQKGRGHYEGDCFVFDHRWSVNPSLKESSWGAHPDQIDRIPEELRDTFKKTLEKN